MDKNGKRKEKKRKEKIIDHTIGQKRREIFALFPIASWGS